MTTSGKVRSNIALIRTIVIPLNDFRMGAASPAEVSVGTSPVIEAFRFSATNELISDDVLMPKNWDRTGDLELVLIASLVATEDNDDSIDWTCDYTVPEKNTTGAGISKASTQVTLAQAVTTANGLAIGDLYEMSFTLDKADATNPFSANAISLCIELHLTNITGVEDIDLVGVCLNYHALY